MPLLNEVGLVGKSRGDFDRAESAYRRALAITQGDNPTRATLLHNLAGLAHARGNVHSAVCLALAGIAIRERVQGSSPEYTADLAALAAILVDLGGHEEARALLVERCVGSGDPCAVPGDYEVAVARHNLGSLQYRTGDLAGAADNLDQALAIKAGLLGPDHPDLAITLHNLARVRLGQGLCTEAADLLERAIALLDGVTAADHPTLVACRERLAQLAR